MPFTVLPNFDLDCLIAVFILLHYSMRNRIRLHLRSIKTSYKGIRLRFCGINILTLFVLLRILAIPLPVNGPYYITTTR